MRVIRNRGALGAQERFVHGAMPRQLLFSRGGRFLVSVSARMVKVWTPSGELVCRLSGLEHEILGEVALLPDGQLIGTQLDAQGKVVLRAWDLRDGSRREERPAPGVLLAANDLGLAVFQGERQELVVADVETLSPRIRVGRSAPMDARRRVTTRLSGDGRFLASSVRVRPDLSENGTIEIWDAKSGILLRSVQTPITPSIAFGADGDLLFHDVIRISSVFANRNWNLATRHPRTGPIAISADGRRLAVEDPTTITAFDLPSGDREIRIDRERSVPPATGGLFDPVPQGRRLADGAIALDDEGRRVAVTDDEGRIELYDAIAGTPLSPAARAFESHRGAIGSAAFASNGRIAATGARDGHARIWDVETERMLFDLEHGGNVRALAFSPDGRFLAAGCDDRSVSLWETGSGRIVWSELVRTHDVRALAFHPSGTILLSAGEGGPVAVHDAMHGRVLRSIATDPRLELNRSLAIHPAGELVAVGGSWLSLCRIANGNVERHLVPPVDGATRHTALAWNADGSRLASGLLDGSAIVVDGKVVVASFAGRGETSGIAFVDGGQALVIARANAPSPLVLVDLASGAVTPAPGHDGGAGALACAPDGRTVLSGGADLRALLFEIADGS